MLLYELTPLRRSGKYEMAELLHTKELFTFNIDNLHKLHIHMACSPQYWKVTVLLKIPPNLEFGCHRSFQIAKISNDSFIFPYNTSWKSTNEFLWLDTTCFCRGLEKNISSPKTLVCTWILWYLITVLGISCKNLFLFNRTTIKPCYWSEL